MYKLSILAFVSLALVGCQSDSTADRTVGGAAVGAVTGAAVGGIVGDSRSSALTGAAVGAAGGALIGRATTPNNCIYERKDGTRFEGRCP